MIDTQNSKPDHYIKGSYSVGTGPEVIVVLGSCRVVPYVNYLDYLNTDNRFTIHLINVVNFYYDQQEKQVDPNEFTKQFEGNPALLATLKACKWFIHEHTENFGMFNTSRAAAKNIYQFGMQPEVNISIPNFNNTFILFQELVNYDAGLRKLAAEDMATLGQLSSGLQAFVRGKGLDAVEDFFRICALTSLPTFGVYFEDHWRAERFFWTGNHVSNVFTRVVFAMLNDAYLRLPTTEEFWTRIRSEDMYATPCTPITQYDVDNYGLTWPQAVEPLKIP